MEEAGEREWCRLAQEALPGMAENSLSEGMLGRVGSGSPVRQRPQAGPCQGAAWRGLDVPKGSSPGTQRAAGSWRGPGAARADPQC